MLKGTEALEMLLKIGPIHNLFEEKQSPYCQHFMNTDILV